jgi:hypothetical protein
MNSMTVPRNDDIGIYKSARQKRLEARLQSLKQCPDCAKEGKGPLPYIDFLLPKSKVQTRPRCGSHHELFKREQTLKMRMEKFGITAERYQHMLESQGGACAICRKSFHSYSIDHDHRCCPEKGTSCGKCVRGLLCSNCNLAIGMLGDDPERLITAAAYLQRHRGT